MYRYIQEGLYHLHFERPMLFVRDISYTAKNSISLAQFKKTILKSEDRPLLRSVYFIHNPIGLKLFTRLRVELSHLNEHKFIHSFRKCVIPLCSCSLKIESNLHFFLHFHHFHHLRVTLLNEIRSIGANILSLCHIEIILYFRYYYMVIAIIMHIKILRY